MINLSELQGEALSRYVEDFHEKNPLPGLVKRPEPSGSESDTPTDHRGTETATVFPWPLRPSGAAELGRDFLHATNERKPGEVNLTPEMRMHLDEIEYALYHYEQALIDSKGETVEPIVVCDQSPISYLESLQNVLSSRDYNELKMIVEAMVIRLDVVHMMILSNKSIASFPKPVYEPTLASLIRGKRR